MHLAERNLEKPLYCEDVSFGHFSLLNCRTLPCPIRKVMQANYDFM